MKISSGMLLVVLATNLVAYHHSGARHTAPPVRLAGLSTVSDTLPAIQFRSEGNCRVPVLTPAAAFKGGTTAGEEVTVRLDTAAKRYQIRIDASITAGRQGVNHNGRLTLDRSDCLYRMSGEAAAQLAVSKDGILFGGLRSDAPDATSPALVVAFKNTSRDIADLSGNWWVFGGSNERSGSGHEANLRPAERSAAAYETRIDADGNFRNCDLKDQSASQCARHGRIFFDGTHFISQEEGGGSGTLIVGQVAGKRVPILLQQTARPAMRFFAPHTDAAPAPPRRLPSQQ